MVTMEDETGRAGRRRRLPAYSTYDGQYVDSYICRTSGILSACQNTAAWRMKTPTTFTAQPQHYYRHLPPRKVEWRLTTTNSYTQTDSVGQSWQIVVASIIRPSMTWAWSEQAFVANPSPGGGAGSEWRNGGGDENKHREGCGEIRRERPARICYSSSLRRSILAKENGISATWRINVASSENISMRIDSTEQGVRLHEEGATYQRLRTALCTHTACRRNRRTCGRQWCGKRLLYLILPSTKKANEEYQLCISLVYPRGALISISPTYSDYDKHAVNQWASDSRPSVKRIMVSAT